MNKRKKNWTDDAACKTQDGSHARLFYSYKKIDIERAKAICAGCPSRIPCYDYAVKNKEPGGIWGGVVFDPAGPMIDQVIVPQSPTYTYTPTRFYSKQSSRTFSDELQRHPEADLGSKTTNESYEVF